MKHELLIVIDFGGHNNSQSFARHIRDNNVYCEVLSHKNTIEDIKSKNAKAFLFTGIIKEDSIEIAKEIFDLGLPILSCTNFTFEERVLGKNLVETSLIMNKLYSINLMTNSLIFKNIPEITDVWINANKSLKDIPSGFNLGAKTDDGIILGVENPKKKYFSIFFDVENHNTAFGNKILSNFLYNVAKFSGDWKMENFTETMIDKLRKQIGTKKVLLALSGGVDSSVAAVMLHRAVGDQLTCVFVDHGLMRLNEGDEVMEELGKFGLNIVRSNSEERFLTKLAGVSDPEEKRKIIGEEFIRVFEHEAKKIGKVDYLVQGTIYPDVIESGTDDQEVIKSHHNVGGIPDVIDFEEIIEPLVDLFKDEVRKVGLVLNIKKELVFRQPFPGPGLAIRIIGDITKEKLDILRKTDYIYREQLEKSKVESWQYFSVLTGIRSVGVTADDKRTYSYTLALRAVDSVDAMTATFTRIPYDILAEISSRITDEVPEINRVVFDITNKPPSTIEWE